MKLFRKDEGFTLVELMVVVLIIGILVAIAIPVFNSAKANAQEKTCFANQRTIEGASQTWEAEFGNMTGLTSVAVLEPGYLKAVPACPGGGDPYDFVASTDGTSTLVGCVKGGTDFHGHY